MTKAYLGSILLVLSATLLSSATAYAQSTAEREQVIKELEAWQEKVKAKEKILLAPSSEDAQPFAEFLSQPDTGLIRLLPREKYDGKLSVRGGGAYYSFTRLTHEYGSSDIELQGDNFSVGFAGADFGYLCLLGDVPLEEVTLNNEVAQFLLSYAAPSVEAEARSAARRSGTGVQVGDYTYKNRLPVRINATYLLRSISYEDSDTLVAFRVLRKDTDGSVILLWKMLKRFPRPQLVRDKTAQM